jgi:hypothetical protein
MGTREERAMRVAKEKVDIRLDMPGAVIRQRKDFGDVRGFDTISGEYFSPESIRHRSSRGSRATSASALTGATCWADG